MRFKNPTENTLKIRWSRGKVIEVPPGGEFDSGEFSAKVVKGVAPQLVPADSKPAPEPAPAEPKKPAKK